MFYLIGLGLNVKGISIEGLEAVKKCQKAYLESYTVELPYKVGELEKSLGKKVVELDRAAVESEMFVEEAKKKDIAMLVYGSPLAATTHISLLLKCKKENIPSKIIHSASVIDAIAETGLQLYKFGKTTSMPKWQGNYKPESFIDIINENIKIKAHTLLLVDIGMPFSKSLKQLTEASANKVKIEKLVVCSRMGTREQDILYNNISKLKKKKVKSPFCIIIPSELHFIEEEALRRFKN